ncbi:MAG: cysteine--tRNA ligase [Thermaerobacter sp.]|nr:cysteine--tRNA ligase [Thermaerobacter sp.]
MIAVYDTLTRGKRPLAPADPTLVRIYVCGVTPYAEAHIGHARPAVVWDVVRRHLTRRGYRVVYVQNYTDVDDKLVDRSRVVQCDIGELARQHIADYEREMALLGVEPPDLAPRVTDHLTDIVRFVAGLVERDRAYEADDGVYFEVRRDPQYGQLSGQHLDEMRPGVRVQVADGKRDPADFALWKRAPSDEPGWESPWGRGRPGWHIECSAMSARYLGEAFDLHGGGVDLVFPHHENERAQSRAYFGVEPAAIWMHNGLITQAAVKMSKSLGNGVSLQALLDRAHPMAVRTYLLSVQYRTPLDFSWQGLDDWSRGMERIWRLWEDVRNEPAPSALPHAPQPQWLQSLQAFEENLLAALDDDFNSARALALVFDMVRDARRGEATPYGRAARGLARANLAKADAVLGILPIDDKTAGRPQSDSVLNELVQWRQAARAGRDWELADQIRDLLDRAGYRLEDTPRGANLRPKEKSRRAGQPSPPV